MNLDSNTQAKIQSWLSGNYDEESKKEIKQLIAENAETALTDAFYKDLEFGTGGLRGLMGIGSNRINKYTIGTATQGLANYLLKKYPNQNIAVAISHDSRNQSDYFANITADVLSANGIKVFLFAALRPTPMLSFAVRELGCKSGVMLTASHNPKEYNGYKAYGADGGQFTSPDDKMVMDEVNAISNIDQVKFERNADHIQYINDSFDQVYIDKIASLSVSPEAIKQQSDLKIVYSPIHGTGITLVPKALEKFGFRNVQIVEAQSEPNGNFPTVVYPNPEEKEALTLALKQAEAIDADLVLATDPDADRVGVAIKNDEGQFILLSGNQTLSLLVNYMLKTREAKGQLNDNSYVVSTIVSSPLVKTICDKKGISYYDTLTGFKWIGKVMTELEGKKTFIAGGEESYGYLVGELVRDKDAVTACAFIAEMAAYYKNQGSSLFGALVDMYIEYGLFKEKLISITKTGKAGAEEIKAMMERYRNNPPKTLGGAKVVLLKDYEKGQQHNLELNTTSELNYPKSDVLQFITADGSIISARPSGTEPKIKFYCSVNSALAAKEEYTHVAAQLEDKVSAIMDELLAS